jgi:phenylpyruvate tautomerase PptA (4-oxalocrotonate tautomerase family)
VSETKEVIAEIDAADDPSTKTSVTNPKVATEDSGPATKKRRKDNISGNKTSGDIDTTEQHSTKKQKKIIAREVAKEMEKILQKQKIEMGKKSKSAKVRLNNVRLQNWKLAMRRNFKKGQAEKTLEPCTIRRAQSHEVRVRTY